MHIALLNAPGNFHTRKWATALHRAGASVTVISMEPGQADQFRTIAIHPNRRLTYLRYLREGKDLAGLLKDIRADLVHPLNVTPFGVWAMKSGMHPCIPMAMGADILEYDPTIARTIPADRSWNGYTSGLKRMASNLVFRHYVSKALEHADHVICDNHVVQGALTGSFGLPEGKVTLIRWGIEPELFEGAASNHDALFQELGIQPGDTVILSPRGLNRFYQADIIVEAFRIVLHRIRDPHLRPVLLGAGYAADAGILSAARELRQRDPRLILAEGAIDRRQMPALWKRSKCFVSLPSFDGFSASLAEGMYAGSIPVVNDIPASHEVLEGGSECCIVPTTNPEDVAAAIIRSIEPHPEWNLVRARNRAWVEREALIERNAARFLEIADRYIIKN